MSKSFAFNTPPPDEGMWLPMLIKDYNYEEMKRLGCTLTPEQIYSVNQSSLKDAIVQLGGFCTAEVISDQGLIVTNHHCGYDAIASQSSEEHNYLKDGFWAKTQQGELPIEGLTVTFLVRMEDVTKRIMDKLDELGEEDADMIIGEEMQQIEIENSEDSRYSVSIEEMFDGNAYYMFVYKTYDDIRLVGAPPSAIGKFGGDTDNWMWPRHTGDFSMMRIYADKDNEPAGYSANNIPMVPKHSLPVSTAGVSEGDFTMVMGFPGSTDRYLTSHEVKNLQENEAPVIIDLLGKRLVIMKSEMDKSEAVEIQHASSRASLANTYKYYKGQLRGLKKFNIIGQKEIYERSLDGWINESDDRKAKYGSMLNDIKQTFESDETLSKDVAIMNMAGFSPDFISLGISLWRLQRSMQASEENDNSAVLKSVTKSGDALFENYTVEMDRKMFVFALNEMKSTISKERRPDLFQSTLYKKKAKGSNERYADLTFKKSIMTNPDLLKKFLANPTLKTLNKDPGMAYLTSLINAFRSTLSPASSMREVRLEDSRELYLRAIQEKENARNFYPDANFTMRMTYGTVKAYDNWEGRPYAPFTYGEEILAKHKEGDSEFDVPDRLLQLLKDKEFGNYANADGKLPVCFLHNTDITGGNSGSPVINGKGELVGIAFDGNWESMTSDLVFQDDYVRTISVDIRYVLFIIDKYAGATRLIDEMNLVGE